MKTITFITNKQLYLVLTIYNNINLLKMTLVNDY